ncbi:MAG TPA: GNAT family N-acetyltransferase, partial [Nitrospirales bacterium]|nr:GNAT family N-acetyltransferase [Nitrospirales bacterium]
TYRRRIRRVSKIGVTIEEARDPAFADEYYDQLEAVFERQQLAPPYGRDRVTRLLASVAGTGRLLLLRARDAAGRCIATAIFPAMNDTMYFWGGATARDCGRAHPNEAVHWYAMRYWKQRGIKRYDMGGAGEYKRKFGAYEIAVPWFRTSRYPGLPMMREAVRRVFAWRQIVVGKAHHLRGYVPSLPIPLSSPSER